jgi:dTDP-4-dehydrorhamnose reductase
LITIAQEITLGSRTHPNEAERGSIALNSSHDAKILIVGIDSQIGAALAGFLATKGMNVFGTTRNADRTDARTFYFDLLESGNALALENFVFVVICAAITDIMECEEAPERSELVNVTNTIKLIDRCNSSGSFVIYPSSNAVFDGTKAFNRHDDVPRPLSKYGGCKLAVEDHIARHSPGNAAVLRFTKIITERSPFLRSWRENAEKGHAIRAFTDKFFSPVPIDDAVAAIFRVMEKRRPGLFQLGGKEEISYFDYARALFANDPAKLALVQPVNQPEPKPYFNHHNSLVTRLPE